MLDELIEEFRDVLNMSDFYSYLNFELAKEEIVNSRASIIFLLGEPGIGKSYMLNLLKYKYPKKYILQSAPFFNKETYKDLDIKNKTLLIDEAQLLTLEVIEFLRILSDKGIQIVLSLHEKDGERILNLPQFSSRYTQKVFLKPLTYQEFEKYINSKFISHNKHNLINKKALKKIYKYAKGNFRLSKKFIFTALNLLDYAFKSKLKYNSIDSCIIEMSAIELGLIK